MMLNDTDPRGFIGIVALILRSVESSACNVVSHTGKQPIEPIGRDISNIDEMGVLSRCYPVIYSISGKIGLCVRIPGKIEIGALSGGRH